MNNLFQFKEGLGHVINPGRLNANSIIIDAGCNIGLFANHYRALFDPFNMNKIIAIEPSRRNCEFIRSEMFENFSLMNTALVGREDISDVVMTEFVGDFKSDGTNQYHQWNNIYGKGKDKISSQVQVNEYKVPVSTLQSIMQRFKIEHVDYLKMDVEGAEYEIFENMTSELAKKITQISLEEHDLEKNEWLTNRLSDLGYKVIQYPDCEIYAYR